MNVILLGPQGSGKGTQAELLAEKYNLVHLEMGRILRSIAQSDNQYASLVKETLEQGKLVSDEYVRLIAWDFVSKHHPKTSGFIFEGYPRSVAQYDQLKDMLAQFGKQIDAVFDIEIGEEETIKRLSARRTCVSCGEIYNMISRPSKVEGVCDVCGNNLIQRTDDTPAAIKQRLAIYRSQTHPVFERAVSDGVGWEINGDQAIDKVFLDIEKKLANI